MILRLSKKPSVLLSSGLSLFVGISSTILSTSIQAAEGDVSVTSIETRAVNGFNRRLGVPIYEYEHIADFGFRTTAVKNPDGGPALELTPETDDSVLLSTFFDLTSVLPGISEGGPFSYNSDVKTVRELPVVVNRDGVTLRSLNGHLSSNQLEVSQAEPSFPVTLGDWKKGHGEVTTRCVEGGENILQVRVTNLLPNRFYGIWEWFSPKGQVPGFPSMPGPPGGVGASIVTDFEGNGLYVTKTKKCLSYDQNVEDSAHGIVTILYWEHQSNGGIPIATASSMRPRLPGNSATAHMYWVKGDGFINGSDAPTEDKQSQE